MWRRIRLNLDSYIFAPLLQGSHCKRCDAVHFRLHHCSCSTGEVLLSGWDLSAATSAFDPACNLQLGLGFPKEHEDRQHVAQEIAACETLAFQAPVDSRCLGSFKGLWKIFKRPLIKGLLKAFKIPLNGLLKAFKRHFEGLYNAFKRPVKEL